LKRQWAGRALDIVVQVYAADGGVDAVDAVGHTARHAYRAHERQRRRSPWGRVLEHAREAEDRQHEGDHGVDLDHAPRLILAEAATGGVGNRTREQQRRSGDHRPAQ
jgi:hypothetical protein